MQEAHEHGASTHKLPDLLKALGPGGMSKSEVSRIGVELDAEVEPSEPDGSRARAPTSPWLEPLRPSRASGAHWSARGRDSTISLTAGHQGNEIP